MDFIAVMPLMSNKIDLILNVDASFEMMEADTKCICIENALHADYPKKGRELVDE